MREERSAKVETGLFPSQASQSLLIIKVPDTSIVTEPMTHMKDGIVLVRNTTAALFTG